MFPIPYNLDPQTIPSTSNSLTNTEHKVPTSTNRLKALITMLTYQCTFRGSCARQTHCAGSATQGRKVDDAC